MSFFRADARPPGGRHVPKYAEFVPREDSNSDRSGEKFSTGDAKYDSLDPGWPRGICNPFCRHGGYGLFFGKRG
jgi:hypothetical protein